MDTKQTDRLVLMIEAVLIVISLAVGGKAIIGMICYWVLVAVYHLSDFLMGRRWDGGK